MLRITQQSDSAAARRYYSTADYLSEGQEIVGSWGGKGAKMLGLEGTVDKLAFERLCDNLDPRDGKKLTVRTKTDRTVGYDFTFSVPKSVSLMYAMTNDQQILGAFRAAVDETMQEIESEMRVRVRKGGQNSERVTGNMTWAEFIHTTSRPVDGIADPQLHSHVFCFNVSKDIDPQEKNWKAGQFRQLKADAPYFQAAFRVRLAGKLQELGFGVERKRDDFEIAGIPAATLKRFSRRTEVIETKAAELEAKLQKENQNPELRLTPAGKAALGASTRERKDHSLSWVELRQEWYDRLNQEERQALATVLRQQGKSPHPERDEVQALDHALSHCLQREAVVSERKLLTEALKRGLGSVTVEGMNSELANRSLIRGVKNGRAMVSTKEALSDEKRIIAFACKGRGKYRPLGDASQPLSRDWLNAGQKAAVCHVLASRDRVTIIKGKPGTGKTTLEQEIGEALLMAGKNVVALAPTAEASRGVLREEAGFVDADTVARFLRDKNMQASARGGVLLIDEASLLSTKDMLQLFHVANRVEARIILVGDIRQNRSVSAGQPLRLLEKQAGLPVAEVNEIMRQSGNYKNAARLLSDGKTLEAFTALDRLGWVREVPDAERYQVMADEYLAASSEKKRNGQKKTVLVVSPTNAEAARITQAIRNALKDQGKLKKEQTLDVWVPAHLTDAQKADPTNYEQGNLIVFHHNVCGFKNGTRMVLGEGEKPPVEYASQFEVFRPTILPIAKGDRVKVTANGKTKDGKSRFSNGAIYTVEGFTPRGDVVIDHGRVIDKDWGHLTSGYAITSYASQGKTVDKVFIGQSSESFPATNQRQFLVGITRGKEKAVVFTDSKKDLLRAIQRADEPMSAIELADQTRHKLPLRHRLKRHLGFMRRLAAFGQTHENVRPTPEITRTQELGRGR